MTRAEFINRLADKLGHLPADEIDATVRKIIDRLSLALQNGDRVNYRKNEMLESLSIDKFSVILLTIAVAIGGQILTRRLIGTERLKMLHEEGQCIDFGHSKKQPQDH